MKKQLIIGLGTGRCGTLSLAELLNQQHDAEFTHECRPLMSWDNDFRERCVTGRLRRIHDRSAGIAGDVASSYLPYVEEILAQNSDVRFPCLKRPRQDVVRSFARWCDKVHTVPTDHWSKSPASGFYRHPIWSTVFPKIEADTREEAIGCTRRSVSGSFGNITGVATRAHDDANARVCLSMSIETAIDTQPTSTVIFSIPAHS